MTNIELAEAALKRAEGACGKCGGLGVCEWTNVKGRTFERPCKDCGGLGTLDDPAIADLARIVLEQAGEIERLKAALVEIVDTNGGPLRGVGGIVSRESHLIARTALTEGEEE